MGKFFDNSGGSLISGAIGMIGGAISDRRNYKNQLKLMERQQQYNKELGEINQGYAKEMAAINQQYALQAGKQSHLYNQEMWDYTNYENQVKHLEAAGLNPALLYGQGGGGGATAAGGAVGNGQGTAGQAPSGGSPQAIKSQIIEGAGMGVQLGLMEAQAEALRAKAAKDNADAEKTAGVDTELTKSLTELNKTEIDVKNMSIEEIAAKAKYWGDLSMESWQKARVLAKEADFKEATFEDNVKKVAYETQGSLIKNLEALSNIELNDAKIQSLNENITIAWYNAATGRMNATTAADKVANDLMIGMKELDIKEQQLLKDWIYQGVHAGVALLEGITDIVKIKALIKAASKGLKEVITKRGKKDQGEWTEETIRELFKD
nr:MAG TPA: DNA pilot protein [Microviridae sp.]